MVVAALATVALLLAMSPAEDRMTETGGPGIVPFEVTGGQHKADEILAEWGETGKDAARESLWIDFGFLVAYGTLLTLALRAVRDMAGRCGWSRFHAAGGVAVWLGVAAAACDALENVFLLLTIGGAGSACPVLATIFAACKFAFLAAGIAYLLAGLVMRFSIKPIRDI
jgi:hypothetical protein